MLAYCNHTNPHTHQNAARLAWEQGLLEGAYVPTDELHLSSYDPADLPGVSLHSVEVSVVDTDEGCERWLESNVFSPAVCGVVCHACLS